MSTLTTLVINVKYISLFTRVLYLVSISSRCTFNDHLDQSLAQDYPIRTSPEFTELFDTDFSVKSQNL